MIEDLEKKNIDVELTDLISLKPFDMDTISKSIKKTHRFLSKIASWPKQLWFLT